MVISKLIYCYGSVSTYCEMCEQITNNFDDIQNGFYQLDWCTFPIKTQRMMIMILMASQRPVEFVGFGNCPARRTTMKQVIKSILLEWIQVKLNCFIISDYKFWFIVFFNFTRVPIRLHGTDVKIKPKIIDQNAGQFWNILKHLN